MSRLKGTTLFAFFFKRFNGREVEHGIVAGADSRLSNTKKIIDIGDKILVINDNIRIMLSGSGKDCEDMCKDLMKEITNRVQTEPLTVIGVADMVITYLNDNLDENKENSNIGSIIVGWDKNEGLQIYQTRLVDKWVRWVQSYTYVCGGSGGPRAARILEREHNRSMSPENAAELGLRALYNATDDKSTGGAPQVFHVHKRGWEKMFTMSAMDVYLKYFNHLDFKDRQEKTLFLVCFQHIYADNLVGYLSVAGVVRSASCVAKVGEFYFHRIVCESSDVAGSLIHHARMLKRTPPPLEKFTTGIYLDNGIPVYIQPCSEDLLNYLSKMKERSYNDLLEVHLNYHEFYYNSCGNEARTLLLASPEKLRREEIRSIKDLFSPPSGEAVIEGDWLGKRGNFHFYRFFFRTGSDAAAAYNHVEMIQDVAPPVQMIPFKIGRIVKPSTQIYVEWSSKILLEQICKLPPQVRPMPYGYILKKPVSE